MIFPSIEHLAARRTRILKFRFSIADRIAWRELAICMSFKFLTSQLVFDLAASDGRIMAYGGHRIRVSCQSRSLINGYHI